MILVKPSVEYLRNMSTELPLDAIESAGRTCYKSEDRIVIDEESGCSESAGSFVKAILKKGHEAMIEFADMTYRVVCDRGVSHEIVRHRLFSFAQESTRYCNYGGDDIQFIVPCWLSKQLEGLEIIEATTDLKYYTNTFKDRTIETIYWIHSMACNEIKYKVALRSLQWTPQQARCFLPNSLKTEIVIKGNVREWRHFFKIRTAKAAHPQMQEVANMILKDAKYRTPILFDEF